MSSRRRACSIQLVRLNGRCSRRAAGVSQVSESMEVSAETLRRVRLADSKLLVLLSATAVLVAAWGGTKTEAGPTPASSQNSANCPKETPFEPGRHARDRAIAAVRESSRAGPKEWRTYKIESAYPAASSEGFWAIVYNWCGPVVGSRSWVVEMYFPNFEPSASLSQGQAFVSRFRSGWRLWYRYHQRTLIGHSARGWPADVTPRPT